MITQSQVGARLAQLRKVSGFTQAQVAEKLGISADTLSRLERGVQWTDFDIFIKLARLYGVEWADLMAVFPDGVGSKQRVLVQQVVDLLKTRNTEEVELARDILRVLFSKDRKHSVT